MGISYFSASALMAVNRLRKFFSESMFSSRWADRRIYLSFSSPRRSNTSLFWIFSRFMCSTSAMGEPVW